MPTDKYVPADLSDAPRQQHNLAPSVHLPSPAPWRADRPGDLEAGQPHGDMLGRPGPNIGYARTLVTRARDRFQLGAHERAVDAGAVVAEIAMKRAALFGRAPVMADVDVAASLLGYEGNASPELVAWRQRAVYDAEEEYALRRVLVDAVPDDVLRLAPSQVAGRAAEVRAAMQATTSHAAS